MTNLLPGLISGNTGGSFVAKQTAIGVVVASIQNTPAELQTSREMVAYFETLGARASSASVDNFGTVKRTAAQGNSTATTVSDLKDDFNALLAKMRLAGQLEQ